MQTIWCITANELRKNDARSACHLGSCDIMRSLGLVSALARPGRSSAGDSGQLLRRLQRSPLRRGSPRAECSVICASKACPTAADDWFLPPGLFLATSIRTTLSPSCYRLYLFHAGKGIGAHRPRPPSDGCAPRWPGGSKTAEPRWPLLEG